MSNLNLCISEYFEFSILEVLSFKVLVLDYSALNSDKFKYLRGFLEFMQLFFILISIEAVQNAHILKYNVKQIVR